MFTYLLRSFRSYGPSVLASSFIVLRHLSLMFHEVAAIFFIVFEMEVSSLCFCSLFTHIPCSKGSAFNNTQSAEYTDFIGTTSIICSRLIPLLKVYKGYIKYMLGPGSGVYKGLELGLEFGVDLAKNIYDLHLFVFTVICTVFGVMFCSDWNRTTKFRIQIRESIKLNSVSPNSVSLFLRRLLYGTSSIIQVPLRGYHRLHRAAVLLLVGLSSTSSQSELPKTILK